MYYFVQKETKFELKKSLGHFARFHVKCTLRGILTILPQRIAGIFQDFQLTCAFMQPGFKDKFSEPGGC